MKQRTLVVEIECFLCILILIFTMLKMNNLVSVVFYTSFFVLAYAFLKEGEFQFKFIAILVLSFIAVMISLFRNGYSFSFEYLKLSIVFISMLIYIFILNRIPVQRSTYKHIIFLCFVFSAMFPIGYYLLGIRTESFGYLSMNFTNCNLLGLWLLQGILAGIVACINSKLKIVKIISLLVAVLDALLLFKNFTRNAIVALLLGLFLFIVFYKKRNTHYPKWVIGISVWMPLIAAIIYFVFIDFFSSNSFFQNYFVDEGKGIDTRIEIWTTSFTVIKHHIFFGDYQAIGGNLHNSAITVVGEYGIFVLILSFNFVHNVLDEINLLCNSFSQKICLTAFLITLFSGIGDGSIFSGSVGLYFMACVYLYLARCNFDGADID